MSEASQPADPSNQARHAGSTWRWLASVFLIIFVIYPLSTGPICKLVQKNLLPPQTLNIYEPLDLLVRNSPLERFFTWYIHDLWRASIQGQVMKAP